MADKLEFRAKLSDILGLASQQGNRLTPDEIEQFFEEDQLSQEQIELVCEYLLSQKVLVPGYEKRTGRVKEKEDEAARLSSEEEKYLEEYMQELSYVREDGKSDARLADYLPKIVDLALALHNPEVFLGDLVQEGNMHLIIALRECGEGAEEAGILETVKAGMMAFAQSQTEVKRQDKRMVHQVARLDEAIHHMTDDMGRKVSVDEVARQMGLTEEQVGDIMKLAGEDAEEEKHEHYEHHHE